MVDLEWNVYCNNDNLNRIEKRNIFRNTCFCKRLLYVKKNSRGKTYEEFKEELRCALLHFWGRCEFEIEVRDLFGRTPVTKVDVYGQVMLNFDKFAEYVYNNLNKIR